MSGLTALGLFASFLLTWPAVVRAWKPMPVWEWDAVWRRWRVR